RRGLRGGEACVSAFRRDVRNGGTVLQLEYVLNGFTRIGLDEAADALDAEPLAGGRQRDRPPVMLPFRSNQRVGLRHIPGLREQREADESVGDDVLVLEPLRLMANGGGEDLAGLRL